MTGAKLAGMRPNLILDMSTRFEYTLSTPDRTPVWLGGSDNLQRKIISAAAIESTWLKKGRRLQYIDVRSVTQYPAYKLQ